MLRRGGRGLRRCGAHGPCRDPPRAPRGLAAAAHAHANHL